MLLNYLNTIFRHILTSKLNFLFRVSGLTLSLVGCLIITIYVTYQLSFDKYHDDYTSVYRVNSIRDEDGKLANYSTVPPAIGPALKSALPEVYSVARVVDAGRLLMRWDQNIMRIEGIVHADNSIFDVLTFRITSGGANAIDNPGTIALTSALAKQLFGNEDPMGKVITFPEFGHKTLEVTAVLEDLPTNTHRPISAIIPFHAFENAIGMDNNWEVGWDGSVSLYLRLQPDANPLVFEQKMQKLVKENIAKHNDERNKNFTVFLQRIDEIYLSEGFKMEFMKKGNAFYVYAFSLLGVFLLAIACINYINLAIADFQSRSKEMGVRKILGAQRKQIATQIAMESAVCCLTALLSSIVILYITFPNVSAHLDPNLSISMVLNPAVIGATIVSVCLVITLSTAYPAIRFALNKPYKDLKKELVFGRDLSVSKLLLLSQFVIAFVCIALTLVISEQLSFIETKNIGFDRTNVIAVVMPEEYPIEKAEVLKNELKKLSAVEEVSYSYYLVTGVPYLKDWYKVEIGNTMKQVQLNEIFVDPEFFNTMNIELFAGRGFDPNNSADRNSAFIVNETAVREFGWDDPIGKRITYGYGDGESSQWEGTVTGVARDFNTSSLHDKIEPLVIRLQFDDFPGMTLNIKTKADAVEALPSIRSMYEKILPGYFLDYRLIDDIYMNRYEEERKALTALQFGTWTIVLIASFGIFSLSMFLASKRMKEFGIRKVLGATVRQITFLHVGYFVGIAVMASIVAIPIAYWMADQWLNGFAYRIEPGIGIFLNVELILLSLILISSAHAAIKAGRMNPVEVLKRE